MAILEFRHKKTGKVLTVLETLYQGEKYLVRDQEGRERVIVRDTVRRHYERVEKPCNTPCSPSQGTKRRRGRKPITLAEIDRNKKLEKFIEVETILDGGEVHPTKNPNMVELKVNGNMFALYTTTSKGIAFWAREEAINKDLLEGFSYSKYGHMFDLNVKIPEYSEQSKEVLEHLITASMNFQIEKKKNTLTAMRKRGEL